MSCGSELHPNRVANIFKIFELEGSANWRKSEEKGRKNICNMLFCYIFAMLAKFR